MGQGTARFHWASLLGFAGQAMANLVTTPRVPSEPGQTAPVERWDRRSKLEHRVVVDKHAATGVDKNVPQLLKCSGKAPNRDKPPFFCTLLFERAAL